MFKEQTLVNQPKCCPARVKVTDAFYVGGYSLLIAFTDGKKKNVDFTNFIQSRALGYLKKYRDINTFKGFKVDNGNVVWGKNWDMIFPVDQLYEGSISV